jgi:hypothetical protein
MTTTKQDLIKLLHLSRQSGFHSGLLDEYIQRDLTSAALKQLEAEFNKLKTIQANLESMQLILQNLLNEEN